MINLRDRVLRNEPIASWMAPSQAPSHSQVVLPQTVPSQTVPPQVVPPQVVPSQAFPSQAFPPQAVPLQAVPSQVFPPQAIPLQAVPPQAASSQVAPSQTGDATEARSSVSTASRAWADSGALTHEPGGPWLESFGAVQLGEGLCRNSRGFWIRLGRFEDFRRWRGPESFQAAAESQGDTASGQTIASLELGRGAESGQASAEN